VIQISALDVQMPRDLQRPGMLLICPVNPHKCCKFGFLFVVRVSHLFNTATKINPVSVAAAAAIAEK
jgi:hypothetical protein